MRLSHGNCEGAGLRAQQVFVSSDLVFIKKRKHQHSHLPLCVCSRESQGEGHQGGLWPPGCPSSFFFFQLHNGNKQKEAYKPLAGMTLPVPAGLDFVFIGSHVTCLVGLAPTRTWKGGGRAEGLPARQEGFLSRLVRGDRTSVPD